MKKLKKILGWTLLSILFIFIVIVIFRDELVLKIIRMEQLTKLDKPYTKQELPELSDSLYQALAADFDPNAHDPIQYVVGEFKNHDIVFLGENHRIRHDLLFLHKLIPSLYAGGIRNMGFEFALNHDSLLIRDVITNKDFFDQEKANQIIFNLSPFWGFKEYIDIFRTAWEVNRTLPEGAEPFMIYGLMHDLDFSLMEKRSDEFDEVMMLKIRKGVVDPERYMANCILNDFVKQHKKTLIYCGIHHAFTGYTRHGKRVGVIVKDSIGEKTMTIALHYPWNGKANSGHRLVYPANGTIDTFIRKHKSKDFAFGIRVNNTTFGHLPDTTSAYIRKEPLTLGDFCDGYIYLAAISSARGVTIQENFITRKNIDFARTQLPNPELRDGLFRFVGTKVLNQIASMDADIEVQFRELY